MSLLQDGSIDQHVGSLGSEPNGIVATIDLLQRSGSRGRTAHSRMAVNEHDFHIILFHAQIEVQNLIRHFRREEDTVLELLGIKPVNIVVGLIQPIHQVFVLEYLGMVGFMADGDQGPGRKGRGDLFHRSAIVDNKFHIP